MDAFLNFAKVTVSTGYDASATSVVLASGHGARLPAAPFNAVWWNWSDYKDPSDDPDVEVVRVTTVATDTLTITRAQEGTVASAKNVGGRTYKMVAGLTAKTFNTDIPALVSGGNRVYGETPAGTINSTDGTDGNDTFTLDHSPDPPESLLLVRATLLLFQGVHYNLTGATITYVSGWYPLTGTEHRAWYDW